MSIRWIRRIPAVVATIGLLAAGCGGDEGDQTDDATVEQSDVAVQSAEPGEAETPTEPPGQAQADESQTDETGSVVDVTVVRVRGYETGDLAGIVMQEADGLVVGGFLTRIDEDPFTSTQRVLRPTDPGTFEGLWPYLSDEDAVLAPGVYVLTLWTDTSLGGYTRWFPTNTDAEGLAGCVHRFEIGDDAVTEIAVGGDVRWTGYVGMCDPNPVILDEDTPSAEAADIVTPEHVPATSPLADELAGDDLAMVQELLVWRSEFLAVEVLEPTRPLPDELPPEIAEQFPPEIQALFPGGLPATLEEAIAVIDAAGLTDEAQDAVESIPGAYDALFALDPLPLRYRFARSADGTEWEQLDPNLPDGALTIIDVAAAGDHLVVVGQPAPIWGWIPPEVTVAWTDDLESWNTMLIAPERPADMPDDASFLAGATVAANRTGWLATVDVGLAPGPTAMPADPSPELAPYLNPGAWGYESVLTRAFGTWDGVPTTTRPVPARAVDDGLVMATNTGFLHITEGVRYTDDGTTWDDRVVLVPDLAPPPGDARPLVFGQLVDNGLVVFVGDRVFLVDDTADSWTPIDVPGLPDAIMPAQMTDGHGIVLEALVDGPAMSELWTVATPDGERWLVEQYQASITDGYDARVAAVRGDTLLVGDAFGSDGDWWTITF